MKTIITLLEPLSRVATDRISRTRAASTIPESDLRLARLHLNIKLGLDEQITTLLGAQPIEEQPFWFVSKTVFCVVLSCISDGVHVICAYQV